MSRSTLIRQIGAKNNQLCDEDTPAHDWYRFVLSFPPHLVRDYLARFGVRAGQCVLDPFCGTGTTLVECKKRGIASVGLEANPMGHFATEVKLDWRPDPDGLLRHARFVAEECDRTLRRDGIIDEPFFEAPASMGSDLRRLTVPQESLLLRNSISPLPLHKTLVLLDLIARHEVPAFVRHEKLALARAVVTSISNLTFGPEVGVGPIKADAPVLAPWLGVVETMASDLRGLKQLDGASGEVVMGDSRRPAEYLPPRSVHAVITSPPYPNEKDYTRTTRLELVLLGFIKDKPGLRELKRGLVRSNTRTVYKDDRDDEFVSGLRSVQRVAEAIEARRVELGKTSGFERLYHRVTRLYFGGMARHLAGLRASLRPGAHLAYVVGDQASYLRVMIRTGNILAEVAETLGYEVLGIDLFRTRLATVTREQLREEVVVLRWPG